MAYVNLGGTTETFRPKIIGGEDFLCLKILLGN